MKLSTNQLYWVLGALNESMEIDTSESLLNPYDSEEENRQWGLKCMDRLNRKSDLCRLITNHLKSLPNSQLELSGVDRDLLN